MPPPSIPTAEKILIKHLIHEGLFYQEIADKMERGLSTIKAIAREYGVEKHISRKVRSRNKKLLGGIV